MQFRTREERLKELDKERALFKNSQVASSPTTSSTSALNGSSNFDLETVPNSNDCIAQNTLRETLRTKVKRNENSTQSFVESVSPLPNNAKIMSREKSKVSLDNKGKSKTFTGDPWAKLLAKESKSRTTGKYFAHDKTLLVLLEEERVKYAQLENEYHKLLSEVQALQTNHIIDSKNQDKKYTLELSKLQKLLISKSQELQNTVNELKQLQQKSLVDSNAWNQTNDKLSQHLEKVERLFKESEGQVEKHEKTINDLLLLKKEYENMLVVKDNQIKSNANALKEMEVECMKEREGRMKLEIKTLQLDHFVVQRDEEISALKSKLIKRERELNEVKEQATLREKKFANENKELATQAKQYSMECERFQDKLSSNNEAIEALKVSESKMILNLEILIKKNNDLNEDINLLKTNSQNQLNEIRAKEAEISEAKTLNSELRASIKSYELDLENSKKYTDTLHIQRDQTQIKQEQLMSTIETLEHELNDSKNSIRELTRRLEMEQKTKNDLKGQYREFTVMAQEKINEVQTTLGQVTLQYEQSNDSENHLRNLLKQRDENINIMNSRIMDLQSQLSQSQSQLSREVSDNENLKNRKKEELANVQEKYDQARSIIESELAQCKSKLSQRTQQVGNLSEEISRMKLDISDIAADRFRLESRVSELTASESSYTRQIANLSNTLSQREQETTLLSLKHGSLIEQIKRLEGEIAAYRDSGKTKDSEVSRLQSNVTDLSRRLRSQVDILLNEHESSTISSPKTNLIPNANALLSSTSGARKSYVGSPALSKRNSGIDRSASPEYSKHTIAGFEDFEDGEQQQKRW